jgi:type I restriction enzyme S subunit
MEYKRLKELASISISNVDKKCNENEQSVRLCNFTDVYRNWAITRNMVLDFMVASAKKSEIDKFTLHKGDVCITKDSETKDDIGMSTYVADDIDNLVLGYHCAVISPDKSQLDGKYLNAFLQTSFVRKFFELNASGSGQRFTLSLDAIGNIPIPMISLDDQKKKGLLFSLIDRKIENNNKINDNLAQYADTIYDYWFTQFDFPDENNLPYRTSGGKMEWRNETKTCIPAGWQIGSLYDIADFINGLACQNYRPQNGEEALHVIKIKEIHEGITDSTEFVSANIPAKYIINNGDILFSWSASLEVAYWFNETAGLNQHIFKIVPKKGLYHYFVYEQLTKYIDKFRRIAESRKTTMGHITSDHISQSRIVIPPAKVISMFEQRMTPILNAQKSVANETRQLVSLRRYLLPLLLNGQTYFED